MLAGGRPRQSQFSGRVTNACFTLKSSQFGLDAEGLARPKETAVRIESTERQYMCKGPQNREDRTIYEKAGMTAFMVPKPKS